MGVTLRRMPFFALRHNGSLQRQKAGGVDRLRVYKGGGGIAARHCDAEQLRTKPGGSQLTGAPRAVIFSPEEEQRNWSATFRKAIKRIALGASGQTAAKVR